MKAPNRRHERIPVAIEAEMEKKSVQIGNLSRGGAFVRGLAAGSLFESVKISLNGMEVEAEIRWVRGTGDTGFGLQFEVELEPDKFLALTGIAG